MKKRETKDVVTPEELRTLLGENLENEVVANKNKTNKNLKKTTEKRNVNTSKMKCPKCGSTELQIVPQMETKGFSLGKGCCGSIIFGPFGWLCGLCGMGKGKSKIVYVCLNCGKQSSLLFGQLI